MTQPEVGAYILLLCHQWSRGEIPQDKDRLKLIAKGEVSNHVTAKFPGGKNARLESERQKQDDWREKQRQNGIASGKARANHRSTTVQPPLNDRGNELATNGQPKGNSPSPSPSPSPVINTHTHTAEIPTLTEIKAFASTNGILPDSAQSFFDHHEGNQLWTNQHGILINWKHKIISWAAKDRSNPKPGKTAPESKQIQEVINVPSW
jgi:hypothetical protein